MLMVESAYLKNDLIQMKVKMEEEMVVVVGKLHEGLVQIPFPDYWN